MSTRVWCRGRRTPKARGKGGAAAAVLLVLASLCAGPFAGHAFAGPPTLSIVRGDSQHVAVHNPFAALEVNATTDGATPAVGDSVTFAINGSGAGGGWAGPTTVSTDASGNATAPTLTANGVAGSFTVTATDTTASTSVTFTLTNDPGPPSVVTVAGGNNQSAQVNSPFNLLSVKVTDADGNAVGSGVIVSWSSSTGSNGSSGNFGGGGTSTTDGSGNASSPALTANSKAGAWSAIATVAGGSQSATFSQTNTPGPAKNVTVNSGNRQSVSVNTRFATLSVGVTDADANAVSGETVLWSASPGTNGSSGTFAGGTSTTDGAGISSGPALTANSKAGTWIATASVTGGTTSASFTLTNTAGAAGSISITGGEPQSVTVNNLFSSLSVSVIDGSGNPVPGDTVTFQVHPAAGGAAAFFWGGGSSFATATDGGGNASTAAALLAANATAGSFTATATEAFAAKSVTFHLSNSPGPPAVVSIAAGNGQSVAITSPVASLRVRVTDSSGNPIAGDLVTFTANAGTNGSSGLFSSGAPVATDLSGSATAPALTANSHTGIWTVTAKEATGSHTATFTLANTAGAAASVATTLGDGQSVAVLTAFGTNLQVQVFDGGGNFVPNDPVTFVAVAATNGASGTFASNLAVITNVFGLASAPALVANSKAGAWTVTATEGHNGHAATFHLVNNPGTPGAERVMAGDPQAIPVAGAFASLQSQVLDGASNPVPGDSVTFAVHPGTGGAAGAFPGNAASLVQPTDPSGVATASSLTANTSTGTWTVTATEALGGKQVIFTLTNVPGAPASVTISGGSGQSASVNSAFAAPLIVTIKDGFGNLVPGASVTFAAPGSGPSGSFAGVVGSATVVADANAVANSPPFTANARAGPYSVTATAAAVVANIALNNAPVAPTPPQFLSAGSTGNLVTIVWSAPAYDGGLPIVSYTITLLSGGRMTGISPAATSLQFVALSNGAHLAVTVSAVNAAGLAGPPAAPVVVTPNKLGYWMVGADGGIFTFNQAGFYGSTGAMHLNKPIVGMNVTPTGIGYWLVASDGGIFTFGDAPFAGSTGAMHLNRPIVGMASTPTGRGYWLVAADGGIFSFGDAPFLGSTGAMHLNQPIVAMSVTPSGRGYRLVAADGGIFAFGDAVFRGSTGAMHLNAPIVGMTSTISGNGYWLVASDGGIFAFGDAVFRGSTGAMHLNQPIVGMAASSTGNGYWLVASDGGIFTFGDAAFYGSQGGTPLSRPVVGIGYQPLTRISS